MHYYIQDEVKPDATYYKKHTPAAAPGASPKGRTLGGSKGSSKGAGGKGGGGPRAALASKGEGKGGGGKGGGGGGGGGAGASVYVGNLSWDVSWQDLKDHFKTVGPVAHADVMLEPGSTRSKGCGLVTFVNPKDASTAISTLHDTELNGRLIFVREDREGGAGGAPINRGGPPPSEGCKIFVGNLPRDGISWMELKDHFKQAGQVVRADIATGPDGSSKGYGTVLLASTREAAKAIQLFNESNFMGRILDVRPDAHPH